MTRPALKPYRGEFHFCVADTDIEHATRQWDALEDAAEKLGIISEGGALGEMKRNEVVADSPLARALERGRS